MSEICWLEILMFIMFLFDPVDSLTSKALPNHVHKKAKQEIWIPTFFKSSVLISWIQASSSSRSPSSTLLWSLMHKLTLEKAWILLNLKLPCSCSWSWCAQICTKSFNPGLDSSSMMHCEHDYARILMSYVKKIQVSIERIFGGNLEF